MKRPLLFGMMVGVLLLGMAGGRALPWLREEAPEAQFYAPDQILVKFYPGTPEKEKEETHQRRKGKGGDVIPEVGIQVVKIPRNKVKEAVKAYRAEAGIQFAEPDYIAEAFYSPRDPAFSRQWGMSKIRAPDAWNVTNGEGSLKIAILDTGIDQDHEDLAGKIMANMNFTPSDTVDDRVGHGTHVAGIAAAMTDNDKGVAGVGFNSRLMNVKVLADDGSGNASWIAAGIIWAANNGANIINLSLGSGFPSDTMKQAVDFAWSKGVVIVAAAGNSNSSLPIFPAFFDNVIAVAATDEKDARATFSNFGPWVDVAAPGVNIFSTLPNHDNVFGVKNYGPLNGTSMAAPHVAGTAALVMAADGKLTNVQVRQKIEASVDSASGFSNPTGRINAFKSVR